MVRHTRLHCKHKHTHTLVCLCTHTHSQDTVPRGGKFISAYKRNGQRVIINKTGDMVVRAARGPLVYHDVVLQRLCTRSPLAAIECGLHPQPCSPPAVHTTHTHTHMRAHTACTAHAHMHMSTQVRPTPLEASMLQLALGSNPLNHLLQSYQVQTLCACDGVCDVMQHAVWVCVQLQLVPRCAVHTHTLTPVTLHTPLHICT
jgi:hypothetical protein